MKNIKYRIGDLELRRTETLGEDRQYLEIVEWYKDDDGSEFCYTICMFKETKEGYDLQSVGDRIVVNETNWIDLRVLIKHGFEFLK